MQPSGLIETVDTDYPWSIVDILLVRFTPCELLRLEICFLLFLGVRSGEAEINLARRASKWIWKYFLKSFVWLSNKLYESSRRKPGWRFTAGFEFKNNGAKHSLFICFSFFNMLYESSRRNQVDGLPPASSFQLNDSFEVFRSKKVESEKYDRSFVILRFLVLFKCYFNANCISQTLNLFIMDSFRYSARSWLWAKILRNNIKQWVV